MTRANAARPLRSEGQSLPARRSCSVSTAATVARTSSETGVSPVLVVTGLSWFSGSSSRSRIVIFGGSGLLISPVYLLRQRLLRVAAPVLLQRVDQLRHEERRHRHT